MYSVQDHCPFAYDDDTTMWTTGHAPFDAKREQTPFRKGGLKEARMRRLETISSVTSKEVLNPDKVVRVKGVPERISKDAIKDEFKSFGNIDDVHIPLDVKSGKTMGYAFVHYDSPDDASAAASNMNGRPLTCESKTAKTINATPLLYPLKCDVPEIKSYFSGNTGSLGIANIPYGEITTVQRSSIKQDISLSDCFARSGYPWGSKHQLKRLEPHAMPHEVSNTYHEYCVYISCTHQPTTMYDPTGKRIVHCSRGWPA